MFDSSLPRLHKVKFHFRAIVSHLDDGLLPFDVRAIQVKPEQRLRSEVMDELNVLVRIECWS